uniref:Uncharacterized protein n=1 Tax=Anopheles melas TaxID=34690 RepID=A0A182UCM1_9DIPT
MLEKFWNAPSPFIERWPPPEPPWPWLVSSGPVDHGLLWSGVLPKPSPLGARQEPMCDDPFIRDEVTVASPTPPHPPADPRASESSRDDSEPQPSDDMAVVMMLDTEDRPPPAATPPLEAAALDAISSPAGPSTSTDGFGPALPTAAPPPALPLLLVRSPIETDEDDEDDSPTIVPTRLSPMSAPDARCLMFSRLLMLSVSSSDCELATHDSFASTEPEYRKSPMVDSHVRNHGPI